MRRSINPVYVAWPHRARRELIRLRSPPRSADILDAMVHRPLPGIDQRISPIALGGYLTFDHQIDQSASQSIIRAAFDAGINFIDLADSYANGGAERAVGACIAQRGSGGIARDKLIISTKVFWPTSRIETPDLPPDP